VEEELVGGRRWRAVDPTHVDMLFSALLGIVKHASKLLHQANPTNCVEHVTIKVE
jgi:hypothetical protein